MFPQLTRSAFGLTFKIAIRNYATRRVIRESSSTPLTTLTRSFQSIGNLQAQPVPTDTPIYAEPFELGVIENCNLSPQVEFPTQSILPNHLNEEPASRATLAQKQATPAKIVEQLATQEPAIPLYHRGTKFDREPYWQKIGRWKEVTEKEFLTHSWQVG
jgi:hypothetical protein